MLLIYQKLKVPFNISLNLYLAFYCCTWECKGIFTSKCCYLWLLLAEYLASVYLSIFNEFLPQKGHLEFSWAFFLGEIFEKVSFDPYNFWKSEQMKSFIGDKIMAISTV